MTAGNLIGVDADLERLGQALKVVAELANKSEVNAVLGKTTSNELITVAAGFRQRFKQHWPQQHQECQAPQPGEECADPVELTD